MNTGALLILIGNLYGENLAAQQRIAELEAQLEAARETKPDAEEEQ